MSTSQYYGIYLYNCSNVVLINNTVNNKYGGIYLKYLTNSTISGNRANNHNYTGIYMKESSKNVISNNVASNNREIGMYLYYKTNNNSISSNYVNNNSKYGIKLYHANNNTIWNNVFAGNLLSNVNSSKYSVNLWDNSTHGNYWGDYAQNYPSAMNNGGIWSLPYNISGSKNDTDRYPLATHTLLSNNNNGVSNSVSLPGYPLLVFLLFNIVGIIFIMKKYRN
jgi:parallel beta-helix repeat protein